MPYPYGTGLIPTSVSGVSADLHVQNICQAVQANIEASRPARTKAAFDGKQKEFMQWAEAQYPGQANACIVTEHKLVAFLSERVVGRVKLKGKGKGVEPVGIETVRQYTSAVKALYNRQKQDGMNSHPDPRGSLVGGLLKHVEQQSNAQARQNFDDPGIGSMLDGYTTTDELAELAMFFYSKNTPAGHRDRAALLLCHAGMMRSETIRELELSQILSFELPMKQEGFTRCVAYQISIFKGKTNRNGRKERAAFIRARDVRACPVNALAFYLFERFMCAQESFPPNNTTFPDFSAPQNWYQIKMMRGTSADVEKAMDYKVHLESCKAAFAACGKHYDKKTHAMRGSSCRMADLAGASESAIERQGRWKEGACTDHYMTTIPREAVRALAGFNPKGGDYWLPRAAIDPPAVLLAMIFPEVEAWEQWHKAQPDENRSIALGGFLHMLKELRVVILQDSVGMRKDFPDNYLWNHEIFELEAYRQYAEQLEQTMNVQQDPAEMRLQAAIPHLVAYLEAFAASVKTGQNAHTVLLETLLKEQREDSKDSTGSLLLLLAGMKKIIEPGFWQISPSKSFSLAPETNAAASAEIHSSEALPAGVYVNSLPSMPKPAPAGLKAPFRMCREVNTVRMVWREYDRGLDGGPSVRFMYEEGGLETWKTGNDSERRFYDRRMLIISFIKRQANLKQLSPEDVADLIDASRRELPAKDRSLAKIQERIKAGEAASACLVSLVEPVSLG